MLNSNLRQRLINSLIEMFNVVNGNNQPPDWLIKMHNNSTDELLIYRMNKWRENYPELWKIHGIYVM